MRLKFRLSMPRNNSWNNKWSGAEKNYFRVIPFTDTKAREIIAKAPYSYSFGDGWVARIDVDAVVGRQKKSDGFCGYDWMIDSIKRHGKIQVKPKEQAEND